MPEIEYNITQQLIDKANTTKDNLSNDNSNEYNIYNFYKIYFIQEKRLIIYIIHVYR